MIERIVLHVDMDSFFVSIERAIDPRLNGKPVLVGGEPSARGVVVACSYEARRLGVRSGMPSGRARALAPEAIVLPCRPKYYTQISVGILRLLCRVTDRIEPASVDEAYLDLTDMAHDWTHAARVGEELRRDVRESYGLAASVGCGPSKTIAKIASRLAKPDGMEVIPPESIAGIVHPLPVSAMAGIGEKTAAHLSLLGIRTIGDLAAADPLRLRRTFGKNGALLSDLARVEDDSPVTPFRASPDPKSMSNERTLPRDTLDPETIDRALLFLSERLARRLRAERLFGNTFHMKIRFADFRTVMRSRTLFSHTNDERTLLSLARDGVRRFSGGEAVRLLGIGLSGLVAAHPDGRELDLDRARVRYRSSLAVFDEVRDRFGEGILKKARLL